VTGCANIYDECRPQELTLVNRPAGAIPTACQAGFAAGGAGLLRSLPAAYPA
jgi:hypothetical protein